MKINIGKYKLTIGLDDNSGSMGSEDMRDTCYAEKVLGLDSKKKECICRRVEDTFGNVIGLEILPVGES